MISIGKLNNNRTAKCYVNKSVLTFASPIHVVRVTNKARWTGTSEVVDAIHTEGIGSTWALLTLVDILQFNASQFPPQPHILRETEQ